MNYHPDKKQLIGFAAGSLKKKARDAVALHISNCEECRNTVNSLSAILMSSDNSSLTPPVRIRNRVLALINEDNKAYSFTPFKYMKLAVRPAVYAIVILVAALSIFIYTNQKSSLVPTDVMMLTHSKGDVLYNGALQKKDTPINSGTVITKEFSSAVLSLDSILSVKMAGNTTLGIIKADKNAGTEITEYNIELDLQSGNILAESDHNIKKKFVVSTKHATFEAIGTSFIISSNDSASKLSVLDGTVRATSKADGKVLLINKSEACTVSTDSMQKIAINPENENKIFHNLFNEAKSAGTKNKTKLIEKIVENSDTEAANNTRADEKAAVKGKETMLELKKTKEEMQKENRQIQKEMRSNMRSGKRSQR